MNTVLHTNESRGRADHGWLISHHTFSFAGYHNPQRMNFGLLRVLNDDIVEPAKGFGTHPHANMEIISIPLAGALRHQDSMGHEDILRAGEVQVMSAGSGLTHAEYNASDTDDLHFLQIWILPKQKDIEPRYEQRSFVREDRQNRFQTLVAPDAAEALWINQDAWLSLAEVDAGNRINYTKHLAKNGVYFFVIEGQIEIDGQAVDRRDGLGLVQGDSYQVRAGSDARLLAIEVPMSRH